MKQSESADPDQRVMGEVNALPSWLDKWTCHQCGAVNGGTDRRCAWCGWSPVTGDLSDLGDLARLLDMKHRYSLTSVQPEIVLFLATKHDAIAAARGLAIGTRGPVLVEDLMAHWNAVNRWRVAPYDKAVKAVGFRTAPPSRVQ